MPEKWVSNNLAGWRAFLGKGSHAQHRQANFKCFVGHLAQLDPPAFEYLELELELLELSPLVTYARQHRRLWMVAIPGLGLMFLP